MKLVLQLGSTNTGGEVVVSVKVNADNNNGSLVLAIAVLVAQPHLSWEVHKNFFLLFLIGVMGIHMA